MDILKKLFEQHFHAPPDRIVPLQGELGGSGRKIIRLANKKSRAVGILYGVREENAAFLEFSKHFRRPSQKFTPKTSTTARISRKT